MPVEQQSFESIGVESRNFIINTGSLLIFQAALLGQLVLIFVLRKIAPKYNVLIHYYRKIKLNQHLNAVMVRFMLEGFVELLLSSLINMELLSKIDLLTS